MTELARMRGIEAFSGSMLADNTKATRLLLSVFPDAERTIEQGELLFRIPLQLRAEAGVASSASTPR